MELFELLKQFKKIEPSASFTETSKRAILATIPREKFSVRRIFAGIFETGVAVALGVFFIMAIAGQFSSSPEIAPIQLSVMDPQALHAEAQAVDMQIQLVKLSYQESTTTPSTATLAQGGIQRPMMAAVMPAATDNTTTTLVDGTSTAPSTSTVSIDDALKALMQ
jgi:hypothetical protein